MAGQGALGCPARPVDAHHGPREELPPRRRRHPGTAAAVDRRAAGRRRRGPVDRQHRREARQLVQLYGADPGRVEVITRASIWMFTPGDRRFAASSCTSRTMPSSCSSSVACSRSRRRICCCAPPISCCATTLRCASDSSLPSSVVRAVAGSPRRASWRSWRSSSASPTSSGFSRPFRRSRWSSGTAQPTSPSSRRTTSLLAWWPPSHRHAEHQSLRLPSAA